MHGGRIRQILLEAAREFRREAAEDLRKLAESAPVVEVENDLPEGFVSPADFVQRLDDICMLNDRVNFLKPKSKQHQRAAQALLAEEYSKTPPARDGPC
jgi:hypothetical protein